MKDQQSSVRCKCKPEPGGEYVRCCVCDNWIWKRKDVLACSLCGHRVGQPPRREGGKQP